jgi:hypothetical protein
MTSETKERLLGANAVFMFLLGVWMLMMSFCVGCGGTIGNVAGVKGDEGEMIVWVTWGEGVDAWAVEQAARDIERDTGGMVRFVLGEKGFRQIDVRWDPGDPWFKECGGCGAFAQPFDHPWKGTRGVGAGPIRIGKEEFKGHVTMVHEMGHLFGLVHDQEEGGVMNDGSGSTHFTGGEIERLKAAIRADDDEAGRG